MEIIIPKCSIREEIEKILELLPKQRMSYNSRFKKAASEEDILAWEQTHGITLPEQYKEWLRFSNGSQIHGQLAIIFGLDEIGKENPFVPEHLVYIGKLVGDFECLCFERATGRIVSFVDVYQEEHLTKYEDFKDFLNQGVISILEGDVEEDIETVVAELRAMSDRLIAMIIKNLKSSTRGPLNERETKKLEGLEEELKLRESQHE